MGRSITACLLLLLTACGGGTPPRPIVPTGQIIAVSDTTSGTYGSDTVRFGRMRSGEVVVKSLVLHNTTSHPVVVTGYTRTCGCTTFEFDSEPILPDSLSPARLTFDSGGFTGWQFKLIVIEVAGAASPLKIYIDAEVE